MSKAVRQVQYIGHKHQKIDNVAGTGLAWTPQEVLPVPVSVASVLCQYPDVWRDVTEAAEAGELFAAPVDDIEKAQLRERVAELEEEVARLKASLAKAKKAKKAKDGEAEEEHEASGPAGADPLGNQPAESEAERPWLPDLSSMNEDQLREFAAREYQMDFTDSDDARTMLLKIQQHVAAAP